MSYAGKGRVDKKAALAMYNGGMSQVEIADKFQVSRTAISNLIARTKANSEQIEEYRANKAQIFEGIQVDLLSAVSADDPKTAQSLVTSAAILEDKIRLERNQATSHSILDVRALIALIPDSSQ